MMLQIVTTGLVLVTASLAAVAAVLQWTVQPRWWTTPVGRLMGALLGVIAGVLTLSTIRALTGAELDTPWFAALRLAVFAAMPFVLAYCVSLQLRLRREERQERTGR
jgi:hypothetical protein